MNRHDVKRGIKSAEFDKVKYNIKVFFSICIGVAVGVLMQSWMWGIVATLIIGTIAARSYYEEGRDN